MTLYKTSLKSERRNIADRKINLYDKMCWVDGNFFFNGSSVFEFLPQRIRSVEGENRSIYGLVEMMNIGGIKRPSNYSEKVGFEGKLKIERREGCDHEMVFYIDDREIFSIISSIIFFDKDAIKITPHIKSYAFSEFGIDGVYAISKARRLRKQGDLQTILPATA